MQIRHDRVIVYVARRDESGASNEFLQLHQAVPNSYGGLWQTLSGEIKPEEKAWEAALRLLRERTGLPPITLFATASLNSFYSAADDTAWLSPAFLAEVHRESEVRLTGGHDESRWVSRKYIETLFAWPGERKKLAEICAEILDDGPARERLKIVIPGRKGNGH